MILNEILFLRLWEIQQICVERVELLMEELLANNLAPDKAAQQLVWVAHMGNLKTRAEENVFRKLVHEGDIVRKFLKNSGMVILSLPTTILLPVKSIRNCRN